MDAKDLRKWTDEFEMEDMADFSSWWKWSLHFEQKLEN